MSHTHDVLRRLLHILESGRALNGISNDRATVYAGALREILESPQPAQADAPAEAREPAKVDTKARMDWAAGILRKLPPLDPTYSIISILDDHDREDRDEVLHSIRVFADMRATQALFTLYRAPADSGEARLTDEQIETLAHRRAYRYRHGPDSIEFIFNRHCLLNFARTLLQGANQS
ncbi:hypothetical protein KTE54_23695 [Burkholderia multivorans]|uniref:hypothetical protein n=1 Tax=Burkholderia multivorans TaxID=87883 RepID=UPI001C25E44D|nr:hypothetical protein [Burkholderia multivorans]MBU9563687.1 hypothetical protein [Burkholderia multivorans]